MTVVVNQFPPRPRCGEAGRSVAAMAAAETHHHETAGRFSGSGLVFGTSGAGLGFFGGSTSERRTARSERAARFAPPEPARPPLPAGPLKTLALALAVLASPSGSTSWPRRSWVRGATPAFSHRCGSP